MDTGPERQFRLQMHRGPAYLPRSCPVHRSTKRHNSLSGMAGGRPKPEFEARVPKRDRHRESTLSWRLGCLAFDSDDVSDKGERDVSYVTFKQRSSFAC